jgi:hypothetical protein
VASLEAALAFDVSTSTVAETAGAAAQ